MRYLKRQEGVVLPLVVGLVAVVAIVIGLAVYQAQRAKTNQATSSPTPSPTTQASSTPTPTATNEIKVAELGFKMTLPAGLTDLKYVAETNLSVTGDKGIERFSKARFSTSSLEQKDSSSVCQAAHAAPLGGITRYDAEPKYLDSGRVARKVGGFYLVFYEPQSACSDNSGTPNLQFSQSALLKQAFDSATAL